MSPIIIITIKNESVTIKKLLMTIHKLLSPNNNLVLVIVIVIVYIQTRAPAIIYGKMRHKSTIANVN